MKRKELKVYHKKKAGRQDRFNFFTAVPYGPYDVDIIWLIKYDVLYTADGFKLHLIQSRYRLNNAKTKEKGILEHKDSSIHGTYSAKDLHIALPANFALQEDYLDNVN